MANSQLPLSDRGSVLADSTRTVPRTEGNNDDRGTPVDIVQYYASTRARFKKIEQYCYPRNVGADPETPHWLKIQIHVRDKNTKVLSLGGGSSGEFHTPEKVALDVTRSSSARAAGAVGFTAAGKAGASVGGAAGDMAGTLTEANPLQSALFSAGGKLFGGVAFGLAGGLLATAAGAININTYQTLKYVIGLGLQESPKADYQATWEAQDLGEFMATGGMSPVSAGREMARSQAGISGKMGEVSGMTNGNITGAQDITSGKVKNPYKQQLFRQMEFRSFNFNFKMLPEDEAEAGNILSMMKLLRATMMPALDPGGYYLIYPAEYSLQYMYKTERNQNVSGIGTSVLTDMKTSYGGEDFVVFRGTRGRPSELSLSLTFREIVPVSADQVLDDQGL